MKKESEESQRLQQAAQDHEEDGRIEIDGSLEPYPAVVREKAKEDNIQAEPEKQSMAAKKALFTGKLIEVNTVSPVPAPRRSRKEGSDEMEADIVNDKDNTVVGVGNKSTPSKCDTPPTETAIIPQQSETKPLQSETTPPQSETTPPQSETTPTGTVAAAQPDTFTKQEAASHSVQAPPRRKRTNKFTGSEVKTPPMSDSPPPQKNGENEEEKKEKDDAKEQSAADQPHSVGESDIDTAVQGDGADPLSVQQQQNVGEALDTGEDDSPAQEGLPLVIVEEGNDPVVGGERVSGPDSVKTTAVASELAGTDAKEPGVEGGLTSREPVGVAEDQAVAVAKHPQENRK